MVFFYNLDYFAVFFENEDSIKLRSYIKYLIHFCNYFQMNFKKHNDYMFSPYLMNEILHLHNFT